MYGETEKETRRRFCVSDTCTEEETCVWESPEKTSGKAQRKRLVKTGKELCILNEDDINYIMDLSHTESQVRTRYTTARLRAR